MGFRYALVGEYEKVAIKEFKGYYSRDCGVRYYQEFYKVFSHLSHNELLILHYLCDNMNNRNEILVDPPLNRELELIIGYFAEGKPADHRCCPETVSEYWCKLKRQSNILIKGEGNTWIISPKIAFKGSKQARKQLVDLWATFEDMRLKSPNIVFNYNSMVKYVRELRDILDQSKVDKSNKKALERLKAANKIYKDSNNINNRLIKARSR